MAIDTKEQDSDTDIESLNAIYKLYFGRGTEVSPDIIRSKKKLRGRMIKILGAALLTVAGAFAANRLRDSSEAEKPHFSPLNHFSAVPRLVIREFSGALLNVELIEQSMESSMKYKIALCANQSNSSASQNFVTGSLSAHSDIKNVRNSMLVTIPQVDGAHISANDADQQQLRSDSIYFSGINNVKVEEEMVGEGIIKEIVPLPSGVYAVIVHLNNGKDQPAILIEPFSVGYRVRVMKYIVSGVNMEGGMLFFAEEAE